MAASENFAERAPFVVRSVCSTGHPLASEVASGNVVETTTGSSEAVSKNATERPGERLPQVLVRAHFFSAP